MKLQHLIELINELKPNTYFKYIRSDEKCEYIKIDMNEPRVYSKTPDGKDHSIADTYLQLLADRIEENVPFNISQLMNNSGSNRPIIETIIAHTKEFYWYQNGRAKYVVWIPTHPHTPGELDEWTDESLIKNTPVRPIVKSIDELIINNLAKQTFSEQELGDILKDMYAEGNAEHSQASNVHLFGLKYGQIIRANKLSTKAIVKRSGISDNYAIELNKGIKLSELIAQKAFGMAFWDGKSKVKNITKSTKGSSTNSVLSDYSFFFPTLRTKPFMLLAGISGTGKSRIVRKLAFKSCPKELQDKDGTEPGNYCMIEVKPNWHDSTELLGYWSNLNKRYMFTKFTKFLVKAKMYPNVPFFVCLDEMNLAPVEQYLAEFLSVLETRKSVEEEDGSIVIKSGVLIDKEYFRSIGKVGKGDKEQGFATCKNDRDIYMKLFDIVDEEEMKAVPQNEETSLLDTGLTLPENVFVIGTVNMDDTTHQFSRKVIDRAMTIEMNGGALTDIFCDKDDLTYTEKPLTMDDLRAEYISAKEVIKNCSAVTGNEDILKYIKGETEDGLPQRLEEINKALYGTPFMVSYRVMNELTIYLAVLLDKAEEDGQEISLEVCKQLANTAIDKILLMKILPRVEGDDEMFRISEKERTANGFSDQADDGHEFTKLDWLRQIAPQHTEDNKDSYMAVDKLSEMIERLNRQSFTRFWP